MVSLRTAYTVSTTPFICKYNINRNVLVLLGKQDYQTSINYSKKASMFTVHLIRTCE
jgi:hypothetical protein